MADKLKIFLFCASLSHGKGGAERIITNLAHEMINRGHAVDMGFDGSGIPVFQQHEKATLVPWTRKVSRKNYKKIIIERDPDLIFVFYFNRHIMNFFRFCVGTKIPFGMQECTNPERLCYTNWKNQTARRVYSVWQREVIAASATRIRMVMPGYEKSFPPYIRQNVRAFPNSAPSIFRRSYPSVSPPKEIRIITIGGLKPNKNMPLLIRGLSQLNNDLPDWKLHNYGMHLNKENKYHNELLELMDTLHLRNKIFFHGPTDDIFSEFVKSHIHVIPSLNEGCPTCVLEAMAHGLPSIGLVSCPGTNELIRHNINGLLVENDATGEGMAKALSTLMHSSRLREELGQQAFIDAKKYQAKDTYDQWENMFYEMAAYKNDPDRLLCEQVAVDKERALHMARCRRKIFQQDYT